MRSFFAHLFVSALALLGTAHFLPGFRVDGLVRAIVAAFVLGFANVLIRPVLLVLTLPLNFLTLGLFTFVVNAAILKIGAALTPGFSIDGWGTAILGSIIVSVMGNAIYWIFESL